MNRYGNFSPEIDTEESKTTTPQDGDVIADAVSGNVSSEKSQSKGLSERKGADLRRPAAGRKKAQATKDKRKKAAKPAKEINPVAVKESVMEWANQKTLKLILGIFFGLFGAYLCVSFVSYLTACISDQSAVINDPVGFASGINNAGGEGGARLSELLINNTFGLGSIVIVVWLLAMAFKHLAGKPRFKTVNFTIKCIVALIAISMIVGLLTLGFNTPVNWGGLHGRYVNEFIISFFGWTGAVMMCLFVIAVFIVICLRDLTNWILRLKKIRDTHRAEVAARRAEEEAKRQAMLEDERIEHQEAAAAGEAVAEEPVDSRQQETLVEFDPSAASSPLIDDEDYESYILTDEDVISQMKNEKEVAPSASNEYSLEELKGSHPEEKVAEPVTEMETQAADDGYKDNSTSETEMTAAAVQDANAPAEVEGETDRAVEPEEVEVMEIRSNTIAQSASAKPAVAKGHYGFSYQFPSTEILRPGPEKINVDRDEQIEKQELIRKTLLDFKIPIDSIDATVGPTVTLYEIVPAVGVKVSTISSLVDDIALRLSATGVRIIAPIPGRGTIGIEVANKDPQVVSMRSIINSEKFKNTKYRLPIALGATIENDVYIADLTKMPHLLVAGATGQGKSVGLNAIIASLLYSKTPEEVKFVMIDPKMVEFSLYAKIENHYLAKLPDEAEPIITDMDKVVATLSSLCVEMDDRYRLLKGHARNVEEYNDKVLKGQLNSMDGHRFLPYIVVIVDEFSDLIMTAGKEVEMPIARLAQKARAVGMHVIIATQRPSTKVITGNIKANFPARISFKVTSGVDSKTILDQSGAQQLIGRGDMLISNLSELVRVQCAFIDTPEVEDIVEHIEHQPHAPGPYILPEPIIQSASGDDDHGFGAPVERDTLLVEAGRSVVMSNQASTSSLQRRYNIGYNRAGRIMDQLEALGVVGPSQGGKPRAVLVDANMFEEIINNL